MLNTCTSLEMHSGKKPAPIIASAVTNPNEPCPCPISNITPRSLAAMISSRTAPSRILAGALGNGRKQCVRMSPFRNRETTSSRLGGGLSRWHITGRPNSSATSSARSSGAGPWPSLAVMPTRTFMPKISSGYSLATFRQAAGFNRRRSPHSPTMMSLLNAKIPGYEILRNARILVSAGSMTCFRKPVKFPGPAVPASINVVKAEDFA